MAILVYSKSNCPQCEQLKTFLSEKQIDHKVINLDDDVVREKFKKDHPTVRTVPYVMINGGIIGGLEGMKKWYAFHSDK